MKMCFQEKVDFLKNSCYVLAAVLGICLNPETPVVHRTDRYNQRPDFVLTDGSPHCEAFPGQDVFVLKSEIPGHLDCATGRVREDPLEWTFQAPIQTAFPLWVDSPRVLQNFLLALKPVYTVCPCVNLKSLAASMSTSSRNPRICDDFDPEARAETTDLHNSWSRSIKFGRSFND